MGSAILASVAGTAGSSTLSSVVVGAATVSSGLVASVVVVAVVAGTTGSETTGAVSWAAGVESVMTWSTTTSAGGAAVVAVGSWTADMVATVGSGGVWDLGEGGKRFGGGRISD